MRNIYRVVIPLLLCAFFAVSSPGTSHAGVDLFLAGNSPIQPPVQSMPPLLGLLIGLILVIGAAIVARILKMRK